MILRIRYLLFVLPLAFVVQLVHAQPTVISPSDIARFNQKTSVIDNFASGVEYDLQSPMELKVNIHRLIVPDNGLAQIVFKVDAPGEGAESYGVDRDSYHIGTLQVSNKVKAKKLNKKQFKDGAPAILFVWPALEWNQTISEFLIDELVLLNGNQRYVFQQLGPNMKKHRKSTGIEDG